MTHTSWMMPNVLVGVPQEFLALALRSLSPQALMSYRHQISNFPFKCSRHSFSRSLRGRGVGPESQAAWTVILSFKTTTRTNEAFRMQSVTLCLWVSWGFLQSFTVWWNGWRCCLGGMPQWRKCSSPCGALAAAALLGVHFGLEVTSESWGSVM